jgi:hypothetical protein
MLRKGCGRVRHATHSYCSRDQRCCSGERGIYKVPVQMLHFFTVRRARDVPAARVTGYIHDQTHGEILGKAAASLENCVWRRTRAYNPWWNEVNGKAVILSGKNQRTTGVHI